MHSGSEDSRVFFKDRNSLTHLSAPPLLLCVLTRAPIVFVAVALDLLLEQAREI